MTSVNVTESAARVLYGTPTPSDVTFSMLERLGMLFYLVDPRKLAFEKHTEVPDFLNMTIPFFLLAVALELVYGLYKKRKTMRLSDSMASLTAGTMQTIMGILFKEVLNGGLRLVFFVHIYENYAIYRLDFTHWGTWLAAFLAVDHAYYWFHRMGHEANIGWASHQAHHSSEDYNLTTALRQGFIQNTVSTWFHLPAALFIPPGVYLAHGYFNTLFQFWLHSEFVPKLGVIEYVFNTPSQHRVHHSRNRIYVDKNYAGTLSIWDRLYGTFQEELDEEPCVYGLTHPLNSYDPIKVQLKQYTSIAQRVYHTPGLLNKLKVVFYGPGWEPGKPRLGINSEIPKVSHPHPKFHKSLSGSLRYYAFGQFVVLMIQSLLFFESAKYLDAKATFAIAIYLMFALTGHGKLLDHQFEGVVYNAAAWLILLSFDAWFFFEFEAVGAEYTFLWYMGDNSVLVRLAVIQRLVAVLSLFYLVGRYTKKGNRFFDNGRLFDVRSRAEIKKIPEVAAEYFADHRPFPGPLHTRAKSLAKDD